MNQDYPKISIVTPSFNQANFLEDTIQSVLSQNYPNLEYIIIDGGSVDGSVEIIKKYENKLTCWISEPDKGHGHALNKGFAKATGDILAWLNSDDKYLPWTFSVVSELFTKHPNIDWLVGCNSWWDGEGRQIDSAPIYKNIYDFLVGDYGWIQQESTFFRRSLWQKVGARINEDYKFMVDGELWCRFFTRSELWHTSAILGGYRIHETNRVHKNVEHCLSEMNKAIDELRSKLSPQYLNTAKKLQKIRLLKKLTKKMRIPIEFEGLIRLVFRKTLANAKYNIVKFNHKNRSWKIVSKDWTI